MIDTYKLENQQLKQELAELRQTIFQVEPTVIYDGRFDEMIISPVATLTIAKQLLQELAQFRQQMTPIQHYQPKTRAAVAHDREDFQSF